MAFWMDLSFGSKPARPTHAAHSGGIELKVVWAVTHVASWRVHTQAVDAVDGVGAFVDVCSGTRTHTHARAREVRNAVSTHTTLFLCVRGCSALTGAVPSAAVQLVAIVTHAAEHPRKVLA